MKKGNLSLKTTHFLTIIGTLVLSGIQAQLTTLTFSYTGNLQTFTVPACVSVMTIEARGAQGGSLTGNGFYSGGLGSIMRGTFSVSTGAVMNIVVGRFGFTDPSSSGGGGASGVGISNTPLIIAGGGGGVDFQNSTYAGMNAVVGTSGNPGNNTGGFGGTNGSDGGDWIYSNVNISRGGRGWNSNNAGSFGQNGVSANTTTTSGTWGLGGGGGSVGYGYCNCGGGGGGYSGGGSGNINVSGGGGGSFNSGTNQVNTAGANTGYGLVLLSYNFNGNGIAANITPSVICTGSSVSLTASGMLSYTWNTGANTPSIVVTPTASGNYTVQGTNSVNCVSSSILSITVSNGLPVLSVTSSTNQTCLGKTVTLTATGALTYTWTGGVTNGVSFTPTSTSSFTVIGENGCGTTSAVTSVTISPIPLSAISSPTTVCAGSSATLTAISPATGFTWQPYGLTGATVVVNPTVTTNYTVTVSDGTCSGVTNVMVNALPVPTIGIVASATIVCQGDQVFMTASGGINYTWTPGNLSGNSVTVSPIGPTLYQVIGDNSVACTSSTTQIVLTNSSPTVNITASSAFVCSGDQVNLVASGANTYSWSNGPGTAAYAVNPAVTTIYSVIGYSTNNPCGATKTVTIAVFDPTFAVSGATTVCSGTSVNLTASGAGSYTWSTSENSPGILVGPLVTSIYTVSATSSSNGLSCSSSNTVQVTVNPNPTVTASSTRTNICKGEKTILTASGAVNYTWSTGGTNASVTVSPTIVTTTNFTVTGADVNGCRRDAVMGVKVNQCTNISEVNGEQKRLLVYPNPNNGDFVIAYDVEVTLSLTNGLGQQIRSIKLSAADDYKVVLSGLSSGIYFITGPCEKHDLNQKIVVQGD